jgi:hypothetical protein
MAGGVSIHVQGLDKAIKKFGKLPELLVDELDHEMSSVAEGFLGRAISDAPVDQHTIKSQLSHKEVGKLWHEVVSGAEHSPYVEFGTRSKVQVPAGLEAYAAQFKGAKRSGDAKKSIYDWCKRVGIPEEAWWPVFIKIMTQGINPHPFFFKHIPWAQSELNRNMKEAVRLALNK